MTLAVILSMLYLRYEKMDTKEVKKTSHPGNSQAEDLVPSWVCDF